MRVSLWWNKYFPLGIGRDTVILKFMSYYYRPCVPGKNMASLSLSKDSRRGLCDIMHNHNVPNYGRCVLITILGLAGLFIASIFTLFNTKIQKLFWIHNFDLINCIFFIPFIIIISKAKRRNK
jgi:hypothetical protein